MGGGGGQGGGGGLWVQKVRIQSDFYFIFVWGSRGGRFWATIMAVSRKKIVQVCEGGALDERVNIGSSHTCWHTV
jgi:hypothetical protein